MAGKLGFILEGEKYHDRYSGRKIEYLELIREVKGIVEADQQDRVNGRQVSETNRAPSAADARR